MSKLTREQWAGAWCAAIVVLSACAVALGAGITVGNGVLALGVLAAPPTVMLLVWSGPPPQTVTEMLYYGEPGKSDQR